jgi:hypothetical protein
MQTLSGGMRTMSSAPGGVGGQIVDFNARLVDKAVMKDRLWLASASGVTGAGTPSDPYLGWEPAIYAAADNGIPIYARGVFGSPNTVAFLDQHVRIYGMGYNTTFKYTGTGNVPVMSYTRTLSLTDNYDILLSHVFEGFRLDGGNHSLVGLKLLGLAYSRLSDLMIGNMAQDAAGSKLIQVDDAVQLLFDNIKYHMSDGWTSAPKRGIEINGGYDTYWRNCDVTRLSSDFGGTPDYGWFLGPAVVDVNVPSFGNQFQSISATNCAVGFYEQEARETKIFGGGFENCGESLHMLGEKAQIEGPSNTGSNQHTFSGKRTFIRGGEWPGTLTINDPACIFQGVHGYTTLNGTGNVIDLLADEHSDPPGAPISAWRTLSVGKYVKLGVFSTDATYSGQGGKGLLFTAAGNEIHICTLATAGADAFKLGDGGILNLSMPVGSPAKLKGGITYGDGNNYVGLQGNGSWNPGTVAPGWANKVSQTFTVTGASSLTSNNDFAIVTPQVVGDMWFFVTITGANTATVYGVNMGAANATPGSIFFRVKCFHHV